MGRISQKTLVKNCKNCNNVKKTVAEAYLTQTAKFNQVELSTIVPLLCQPSCTDNEKMQRQNYKRKQTEQIKAKRY